MTLTCAYLFCRAWYNGSKPNANSWIALYNDIVFNKYNYTFCHQEQWKYLGSKLKTETMQTISKIHCFVVLV